MKGTLGLALTAAITAAACGSIHTTTNDPAEAIADAEPGAVVRIAPGRYEGRFVLDSPVTLIADDVVIVAPPDGTGLEIVNAEHVSVSGLRVEGGATGIRVAHADQVTLTDVSVSNAFRHGILVENGHAQITNCRIDALTSPYARGIEIRNSELHSTSEVSDCTITGPVYEGIASRLSHVRFVANTVSNATHTGIAVTEMSTGEISESHVGEGYGAGILCGDMSTCEIHNNTVTAIAATSQQISTQGHGVVVQYHSVATISALATADLDGDRLLMSLDGVVRNKE